MVSLLRRNGTPIDSLEDLEENPRPLRSDAGAIARELIDELQNRGLLTSVHEAKAILDTETDPGFRCTKCGSRVSKEQGQCDRCGNTQAIPSSLELACKDCGSPVDDAEWPSCANCGGLQVKVVSGTEAFECERCGEGIRDPESLTACPRCRHGRVVRREKK